MKVILSGTWWGLFWAYLMKVILSVPDEGYSERYLMRVILSVPDEGYSERTWWRLFWTYLMRVILSVPDEGYSERTWWGLFQTHVVCIKFDIYLLTAYLVCSNVVNYFNIACLYTIYIECLMLCMIFIYYKKVKLERIWNWSFIRPFIVWKDGYLSIKTLIYNVVSTTRLLR